MDVSKIESDWQAEMDADTIIRANEVRKSPDRLRRARRQMQERVSIAQTALAEENARTNLSQLGKGKFGKKKKKC